MRFFANKIIIALNDLTPSPSPELNHEYGLPKNDIPNKALPTWTGGPGADADLVQRLNNRPQQNAHGISWNGKSLKRDTPEWDAADNDVKTHFGGKIGLHDLAAAYHMPGMKSQRLDFGTIGSSIGASYTGHHPQTEVSFNYQLRHQIDDKGNHSVYWDGMNNTNEEGEDERKNGSSSMLPNLLRRVGPVYKKAGIKHIDTDAVGTPDGEMNGHHTWGTLGFGFQDPNHLSKAKSDAKKIGGEQEQIDAATHPFHFQQIARQMAQRPNAMFNAKQYYSHMLGNSFKGRLNMDPNDPGYQRLQRFLGHVNKPQRGHQ